MQTPDDVEDRTDADPADGHYSVIVWDYNYDSLYDPMISKMKTDLLELYLSKDQNS